MKKILVIDDLTENLDSAKEFFSTVNNLEVGYATSRKQAEKMMESCNYDGILTDRSFPYEEGETADDYSDNYKLEELMKMNGDVVMINTAISKNIPFVMCTSHGHCNYLYYLVVDRSEIPDFENKLNYFQSYKGDWRKSTREDREKVIDIYSLKGRLGRRHESTRKAKQEDVEWPKTDVRFWSVAWERLQEQI